MDSSQGRIGLLPEHLIDQIKAGEVIERPANLIKEILENSIDAGANKLELTIQGNGLELISLKDNGVGIHPDDLMMAFSRHATSKINRFEDLYRLHSFGFRGEALASIAAISKVQCTTFRDEEQPGSEIKIEGGKTIGQEKRDNSARIKGTNLTIHNLFYNTPVRLKFIQSQQAEKKFLKKIIFSFILAHPHINFILKFNEEEKEVYVARSSIKERILDFIPKAQGHIQHQIRQYEDNQFEIYLIPGNVKAPIKLQYILVNNRFVIDKQLSRVISQALISFFGTDDFHFVASLNVPSDHIDVNVHPNKTIIKLFEPSKLIGVITATIKELGKPSPINGHERPPLPSTSLLTPSDFPRELASGRQNYNMEGEYSPHGKPESKEIFIWMSPFLVTQKDQTWLAINAPKLLKEYITEKMKTPSPNIPLLVSEPFKVKEINSLHIKDLINAGLELEHLASDTIVLRSVPDWMSDFPLREIVEKLIKGDEVSSVSINPQDWSHSSWIQMLHFFPLSFLIQKKVVLELPQLFEEKLK